MSNFPASNDAGQRIRIHQLPNQQGLAVIQKGAIVSHECSAYRWPLSPTWKNFLLKLLKQRKLLNFSSSKSSSVSQALQDCNSHAESAAVNLSQALPKGCYKPVKPGRVHSNKKQVKRDCKVERGGRGWHEGSKNSLNQNAFLLCPFRAKGISNIERQSNENIAHMVEDTQTPGFALMCCFWCITHSSPRKMNRSLLLWPIPSPETVLLALTSSKGFLSFLCQYTESTWTSLPGKDNVTGAWFWELTCTGLQNKMTEAIKKRTFNFQTHTRKCFLFPQYKAYYSNTCLCSPEISILILCCFYVYASKRFKKPVLVANSLWPNQSVQSALSLDTSYMAMTECARVSCSTNTLSQHCSWDR